MKKILLKRFFFTAALLLCLLSRGSAQQTTSTFFTTTSIAPITTVSTTVLIPLITTVSTTVPFPLITTISTTAGNSTSIRPATSALTSISIGPTTSISFTTSSIFGGIVTTTIFGATTTIPGASTVPVISSTTTGDTTTIATGTSTISGQTTTSFLSTSSVFGGIPPEITSTTTIANLSDIECPFTLAAGGRRREQLLRNFRDGQLDTVVGCLLAVMYYQNVREINSILQDDQLLRERFSSLVRQNLPLLADLLSTGSARLSAVQQLAVADFLRDLQSRGSLKLSRDIDFLLYGIESGWLLRWMGIAEQ